MKKGKDYIAVGVGAAIINSNKEILLLKRNTSPNKGAWSIPGGEVEMFETLKTAVIREIKEEIDVDINPQQALCVSDHIIDKEKVHWVAVSFLCTIIKGEPKNKEKEKHEEMKWFKISEVPDNLSEPTQNAIKELKEILD